MRRLPISLRRVAVFVGILVLLLMIMDFNARLEKLNVLRKQAEIVGAQATEAVQTQLALHTQVAYATSDHVVHEWARTEGHYIQNGDQPVVPVEVPGAAPAAHSSPTPLPTPLPNWQIWWSLFFDE